MVPKTKPIIEQYIITMVWLPRYPREVMEEVNGLAAQLTELVDYRKDKQEREANRIKFVQAGSGKA